jgi:hypothetical protein
LMSTDFFVTKDVAGFADFIAAIEGGTLSLIGHFITHPRLLWLFLRARTRCGSPLELRYGSTTPYQFGPRVVKYSVRPQIDSPTPIQSRPDADYLRLAMARTLAQREARFDFLVQIQTDAERMPIEDPRVVWDEFSSPFVKLATIRIPAQEFDTESQRVLGENMHFTPWHSLPEHRPLGGVNRGRKVIYEEMSRFRNKETVCSTWSRSLGELTGPRKRVRFSSLPNAVRCRAYGRAVAQRPVSISKAIATRSLRELSATIVREDIHDRARNRLLRSFDHLSEQ